MASAVAAFQIINSLNIEFIIQGTSKNDVRLIPPISAFTFQLGGESGGSAG